MATSFASQVNSLRFYDQLVELERLLPMEACTRVTFWGERLVEGLGDDGSFSSINLNNLARTVLDVGKNKCMNHTFTASERVAGLQIEAKIRTYYRVTDEQTKRSSFFTRFLTWLRDFFAFGVRTQIEKDLNFRTYSEDNYRATFTAPHRLGDRTAQQSYQEHCDRSLPSGIVAKVGSITAVAGEERIQAFKTAYSRQRQAMYMDACRNAGL
jgi:hypothetical protein